MIKVNVTFKTFFSPCSLIRKLAGEFNTCLLSDINHLSFQIVSILALAAVARAGAPLAYAGGFASVSFLIPFRTVPFHK